jgi:uncharacterized protein YodC (DUF2158 family)
LGENNIAALTAGKKKGGPLRIVSLVSSLGTIFLGAVEWNWHDMHGLSSCSLRIEV